MTLGIAIPTYVKHVCYLDPLLANITTSTLRPDKISVSCSSMPFDMVLKVTYNSVPVLLQYTKESLNPAQNRNRAAAVLDTDILSFIDGDDLMHPRRLEYIQFVFSNHPSIDVVYHSYSRGLDYPHTFESIDQPTLLLNVIEPNPDAWGVRVSTSPLHHAHVSMRRSIFETFKFDESSDHAFREDSVYAKKLLEHGIRPAYIENPLSHYIK